MKNAFRPSGDQATGLYRMRQQADERKQEHPSLNNMVRGQLSRVIAVTSGKGGVGKSTISGNLATVFAKHGAQVLAIDADLGLADLNFIFGITPQYSLADVINGKRATSEIITSAPCGVEVLPAYHGSFELANLGDSQRSALFSAIDTLPNHYDVVVIDTGAGLNSNAVWFAAAATDVLVVITKDPTSLADAYAVVKVLSTRFSVRSFLVMVNKTQSAQEAEDIFCRFEKLANKFLNVKISLLGYLYDDHLVEQAVLDGQPFVIGQPQAHASRCMDAIATRLLNEAPGRLSGGIQLFWRQLSHMSQGAYAL